MAARAPEMSPAGAAGRARLGLPPARATVPALPTATGLATVFKSSLQSEPQTLPGVLSPTSAGDAAHRHGPTLGRVPSAREARGTSWEGDSLKGLTAPKHTAGKHRQSQRFPGLDMHYSLHQSTCTCTVEKTVSLIL